MSHFIIKCQNCGKIIAQCRCPESTKPTTWSTCEECGGSGGILEFTLTDTQKETIRYLASGLSYKALAQKMGISHVTMKDRMRNIFDILGVRDRTSALLKALRLGIVKREDLEAPKHVKERSDE